MQIDLLNRQRWRTKMDLALAMAEYIEDFYNPARRHSSLGYLTPNEFEDVVDVRVIPQPNVQVIHHAGSWDSCLLHPTSSRPADRADEVGDLTGEVVGRRPAQL